MLFFLKYYGWEGRSIPRINVYLSTNKSCLSLWKQTNIINLTLGSLLTTLGYSAMSGVHCWSLLLAYWAVSSVCSKIILVVEVHVCGPCIICITASMTTMHHYCMEDGGIHLRRYGGTPEISEWLHLGQQENGELSPTALRNKTWQ